MIGDIHFEIGIQHENETMHVFLSKKLSDVLKEWETKGYTAPQYFVDVWEINQDGTPYPLADIKIEA